MDWNSLIDVAIYVMVLVVLGAAGSAVLWIFIKDMEV